MNQSYHESNKSRCMKFSCFFSPKKDHIIYNFLLCTSSGSLLFKQYQSNLRHRTKWRGRRQKEMLATDKFLFPLFSDLQKKEGESPRSFLKEKQAPCCIFCSLLGRRATKRKLTKLPTKIDFFLKGRFFTIVCSCITFYADEVITTLVITIQVLHCVCSIALQVIDHIFCRNRNSTIQFLYTWKLSLPELYVWTTCTFLSH